MGESKPPIKILREPEFRGFEKTRISRIGEEGAGHSAFDHCVQMTHAAHTVRHLSSL